MKKYSHIIFCIVVFLSWQTICRCQNPIPDKDAIDAIVGEASNQDFYTMVCVADALRNRGNLKGVYGYHAKHNQYESSKVWLEAKLAWDESANSYDQVNGAKNWGTFQDLEKENYPNIITTCGDLYFY